MKKLLLFVVSAIMLVPASVKADEGMWFLMFIERLNHRDMQKMGLQLTAEEIYSINNHSLKDAIVQFNGGCTAEMISKDGLVLTNHHCGYDNIQSHSTVENDYLTNGFCAYKMEDELPNKDLTVTFIIKIEDVTTKIFEGVLNLPTESDKQKKIQQNIATVSKSFQKEAWQDVMIRAFYDGKQY